MKSPDDQSPKTTDPTTASSSLSREDEAAVFEKWKYLIVHILHNNYSWAWSGRADKKGRKLKRPLDYGDLYQEASMGLLDAFRNFNSKHKSKASFKTYAYRAISSRVADFVGKNQTPVSVSYIWRIRQDGVSEITKSQIGRALKCDFFSETFPPRTSQTISPEHDVQYKEWESSIIDHQGETDYDKIDTDDFVQAVSEKLIEALTKDEWKLLSYKIGGLSNKKIAERRSVSEETIRLRINAIFERARSILRAGQTDCDA